MEKLLIAAYSSGKVVGVATAGMTIATIVVMVMTNPTSRRELVVALLCTTVASFCGGAAVVQYFSLQSWASDFFGLVALMGVSFTCGLPAWVIVRGAFIWSEKNKDKGLPDMISDIRGRIK